MNPLTERTKQLEEAIASAIDEISWFARRKKNLADQVEGKDKTWADILDADLDILRKALKGEDA